MLSGFKAFTITHNEVKAGSLSNFVLDQAEQAQSLGTLKEQFHIKELLYLNTCNRVLFFVYTDPHQNLDKAAFLKAFNPALTDDLIDQVRLYANHEALTHLYRVAASLESMVIGEREIFRQLREAYTHCKSMGLCGDNIRLAMRFCVESSKAIYANTRIGERKVSVVSLAMEQFSKRSLDKSLPVVLIGAGQTIDLVCKFLPKLGFQNIRIFNRTIEKAALLAEQFQEGKAYTLDQLDQFNEPFQAMIVCTASTEAIITKELISRPALQSTSKLIVDLSIPFNVEKSVQDLDQVELITVEELQEIAKVNISFRQNEMEHAMAIISERLEEFKTIYQQRRIERAMEDVPKAIKKIKDRAVNEVFQKELAELDADTQALFIKALDYMEKKCIGIPMKAAKNIVK